MAKDINEFMELVLSEESTAEWNERSDALVEDLKQDAENSPEVILGLVDRQWALFVIKKYHEWLSS